MVLSRTTAGDLSYVPKLFGTRDLTFMIVALDGKYCPFCTLPLHSGSIEYMLACQGTYVAIISCDFCGNQCRVSPKDELVD